LLCALVLLVPVSAQALEGLHVGDKAPLFSLADLSGAPHSLDALGERPRVVLFWSTWSPRSLEVLRDFRAIHERWAADGLAIVAINADGESLDAARRQAVREYAARLGLPFPVLLDSGLRTYAAYGVLALPSAVVVDAGGRIAYALGGYPETLREELKEKIEVAMGAAPQRPVAVAAAQPAVPAAGEPAADEPPASRCSLPRAFYCSLAAERARPAAAPPVMALRLSICRGEAEEAERLLQGVSRQARWSPDLLFAQGNLQLLEGRTKEARQTFSMLRGSYPMEGWGDWGLGLAALAEGDPDRALGHMLAAGAGTGVLPEAETAVLKYLEGYWSSRRAAPREEQFLALFRDLEGVRACYRKLVTRG
jgi:peroxiredoxin